ncbi:MAG TPA: molybdate ABC transporter substrate-binding protein [Casimicrobiaceae bacterium]|nr:molybdate ABC transporter substrate-binding protein [Casimicrobiaceae bacterium]
MLGAPAAADETMLRVYAAGSLSAAIIDIAAAFTASGGPPVATTFGPSGLLRERIEKGEPAAVFASADVDHPQALARAGRSGPAIVFARNRLCALAAPGVEVSSATLLDRMLDPTVKLGTSTPKADPSGDYAWQLFEKAEKLRPGASAALEAKALKLVGGPGAPQAPPGRTVYGMLISERKADVFLTYCTNAAQAAREVPGARVVAVPEPLSVGASYALAVIDPTRPGAERFALFVLSIRGQEILAQHGFTPVGAR